MCEERRLRARRSATNFVLPRLAKSYNTVPSNIAREARPVDKDGALLHLLARLTGTPRCNEDVNIKTPWASHKASQMLTGKNISFFGVARLNGQGRAEQ